MTWVALVADTVSMEEPPAGSELGFAVIVTVGGPGGTTVTVVVAVIVPVVPTPVAVAVYVVVVVGLTDWVPPLGCNEYVVPSVPVITTCVALVAATVSIDDAPDVMDVGLAMILTVAGTDAAPTAILAVAVALPPAPVAVAVYVVVVAGLTD